MPWDSEGESAYRQCLPSQHDPPASPGSQGDSEASTDLDIEHVSF